MCRATATLPLGLFGLQVWHAVLGYISSFEQELWELEDDAAAVERVKAAVAAYKGAA